MSTDSPITARFTVTSKIAAVTSDDNNRWVLNSVRVEPVRMMENVAIGRKAKTFEPITSRQPVAEVYTVATNGIALGIRREAGLASKECLLPNSLAKPGTKKQVNRVALNGRWESTTGKIAEETSGRYPAVKSIVEQMPTDSVVITLDAAQLRKLSDAIGDGSNHKISLIINPDSPGVMGVISHADSPSTFGLLMSCISETNLQNTPIVDRFNRRVAEYQANDKFIREDDHIEWETAVSEILNPADVKTDKPVTIFKKPASCDVRGADALRVGPILGLSVSLPEIDPWCSFPSHQMADYVAQLESLGITVRIVEAV